MFGPVKALSSLTKPTSDNKAIDGAIRALASRSNPFQTGQLIEVALTTGTTKVNHTLGKAWTGYLVVGQDAAGSIFHDVAANTQPASMIPLKASASLTVKLWIF